MGGQVWAVPYTNYARNHRGLGHAGAKSKFVPSTNILTSQLSLIEHVVSIMIMMINNHYNPENLLAANCDMTATEATKQIPCNKTTNSIIKALTVIKKTHILGVWLFLLLQV